MFYKVCKFICMLAFRIWYSIEYKGLENIPNGGGYIIICNHRSNLDPIILAGKVKKPICYMGKAELFKNPILSFIFRHVNAFPVDRGSGDNSAIETSAKIIADRKILGMFPEGTRSRDGAPLRPKSGVALIAKMAYADVLPCSISYSDIGKFRSKVVVNYGKIISYDELGFTDSQSPREIKYATRLMFSRVLELLGEKGNEDNNM
ncbi:MAG: lysophospholipid acyltransferase family protein [Oscillospiraceae bacterium]